MTTIHIAASREYDVVIEPGLLTRLGTMAAELGLGRRAAVISDDAVFALYGAAAEKALTDAGFQVDHFLFPHGEQQKNLSTYGQVLNFLCDRRFTRSDFLVALGGGAVLAGTQLLHFYSSDEAVIAAGYERLWIICGTYLLCGIMDVLASSLRGLGYSVLPMVVSLVGSCLLRLVWIATIFQLNRTPFMLYISYPISWILTASVHLICLLVVRRKLQKKGQNLQAA